MAELPPLVRAMLNPALYPDPAPKVELVQTHISFVFLAGDFVYKVKKPVDFGFLDFTTLERRHHFCQREVELNRRLAPDIYLGVVPITCDGDRFAIDGPGQVVEYAVKMRRLPQERMMDEMLARGVVTAAMVERLARLLADFHARAEHGDEVSAYGDLPAIVQNTEENFDQTEKYIGVSITQDAYDAIAAYTRRFIAENGALFAKRRAQGRIRDCHGDLHSAHICLDDGIYIYDCIEFNERFRCSDVAVEVAFLAMDLDYHGCSELSDAFVAAYVAESGDAELYPLLNFYKCYRAYVRGKVISFLLDDPAMPAPERERVIVAIARRYFDLAYGYSLSPALIIMSGLPGTGKSTVAQALGQRLSFPIFSSDAMRKELAGIPPTEHHFEPLDRGIYSPDFTQRTYQALLDAARPLLAQGRSAILDASYRRADARRQAQALAQEMGAKLFAVECVLDEETVRERLAQRLAEEGVISDGRWEIYVAHQADFEPVVEAPPGGHLVVDTAGPVPGIVDTLLERMAPSAPERNP